jgi:acyl-coenzyme A thioesterase PaaI-like protein
VKGNIVRRGRRIIFAEAVMTNDDGVVLAKGTQTAVPVVPVVEI